MVSSNSFWMLFWTIFSFCFSLVNVVVWEPNKLPDGPHVWELADESCARTLKFPKLLSVLKVGGWNELRIGGQGWNNGGGGGMNGPGGGEKDGGKGSGDRLLLDPGSWRSLNLIKRFWISGSFPGGVGAPFIRSPGRTFLFNIEFSKQRPNYWIFNIKSGNVFKNKL